MFELTVKTHFDAAHRLRNYVGKCAQVHGHTWHVEILVTGDKLDDTGMLIDFAELKSIINEEVTLFDHRYINELEAFGEEGLNPTAENLAAYLFREIQVKLEDAKPGVNLKEIRVWESPNACAAYREG